MSLGKVIYNILSNDADVSAIVSTKIFPYLAVEDVAYPYIVYDNTGLSATDTKDGVSSLDIEEYDIEIYSEDLAEINDLSIKIRNAIDRYSGTVEGIQVQSIKYVSSDIGFADQDRVYVKIQSYSIRYFTVYNTLAKPTNLAGSASSTSQNDLTWTDNSTGESGFEVWRSTNLTSWTLVTTTSANATSYSDTGLSTATQYYYRVRATDGTDGGEWSNVIGVRTDNSGGASPSGIAYRFTPITGALTSYATDDAAYNEVNGLTDTYTPPVYPVYFQNLDKDAVNPFITLLYNNEAGGTDRFTDENNLQVFAAGLVKDHLTKKMWILKSTATWANALIGASGASDGGFTDWRIPDINELNSIIDKNVGLGYAPFSFNTDQIWTSNTSASNTLRASTFETDNRGRLLDQVKTSLFKVFYVRNW